jgi:hypothetical protein
MHFMRKSQQQLFALAELKLVIRIDSILEPNNLSLTLIRTLRSLSHIASVAGTAEASKGRNG